MLFSHDFGHDPGRAATWRGGQVFPRLATRTSGTAGPAQVEIDAKVRRGTREEALRLSLAVNATHGKQRTAGAGCTVAAAMVRSRQPGSSDASGPG